MSRADRVREAQQLRAQGLLLREIAARMGASRSSVSAYLTDPDLSKQRERRKHYQGVCACGSPTDGSSGPGKAPKRCQRCERSYQRTDEYRAARTVWTRERIIAAIHWWADTYGEPPASNDWNPAEAYDYLHDTERAMRAIRHLDEGLIPWFTTVVERFGSWNAGIAAAGFQPRRAGGFAENQVRRRNVKREALA